MIPLIKCIRLIFNLIIDLAGFGSTVCGKDTVNCIPTQTWYIPLASVITLRIGSSLRSPGVLPLLLSHPKVARDIKLVSFPNFSFKNNVTRV